MADQQETAGSPSSPLSSPPKSQPPPPEAATAPLRKRQSNPATSKAYRSARPLPFELNSQIAIYFEENLYTQAFALLQSLVTSSAHAEAGEPTYVPSPAQLAIASTLTVHPSLTTRTADREKWAQADGALRLLRTVGQVLGPVHADFIGALSFVKVPVGRAENGNGYALRNGDKRKKIGSNSRINEAGIENQYAQEESLYSQAEDFWHVVGWAFNCSKLHPRRWERWILWLEWMVGALEDDWRAREQDGAIKESLIWSYINDASGGHGRDRRIIRSIFANGNARVLNEFREIFRNEHKEPKKDKLNIIKKREVDVNVEAEVYGDYMSRDEDDTSEDEVDGAGPAARTRIRDANMKNMTPKASAGSLNSCYEEGDERSEDGPGMLFGIDSLRLRVRLLQLLSNLSVKLPDEFETGEELYSKFVEVVRPLPLTTFQAITSAAMVPDMWCTDAQTTLCEFLLNRSLLEAAAPETSEPYLRQSKMEKCYLPFAATSSSIADNAKVSLCLESLLQHLRRAGKLTARSGLELAVHKGIQRRCEKATGGVRKSLSAKRRDEISWTMLLESGERLRDVLKCI